MPGSWRRRVFWVAVPGAAVVSVGVFLWATAAEESAGVDAAIREIGFFPINPPTVLTSVGSIYHVSDFGTQYNTICRVSTSQLQNKLKYSPTERVVAQKLVNASAALSGKWLDEFKQSVGYSSISTINYRLTDVEVGEVSLADLASISGKLQLNADCASQIQSLLLAGEFVCQGQQILRASAYYDVNFEKDLGGKTEIDTDLFVKELRDRIRVDIDPTAKVVGKQVRSGEGLHYGIRVTPLCMTLPDSVLAARLPSTTLGWMWHSFRKRLPW